MDDAVEAGGLAAQQVDPLGRCHGAGEHRSLYLEDVGLEFFHHGRVPRYHLIQDRPEYGFGAQSEQFRALLQPPPCLAQFGCLALPYGDHA